MPRKETKKAKAARLQQARDAAADAAEHDISRPWRKTNSRLFDKPARP